MRLKRYRVANFRSVVDSGWIDVERVTALIGVNESGKTNLLLPLWKLNPAREGEIIPTSDYPKGNYAAVRANPGDFIFITAEFEVPELAEKLAALTGAPSDEMALVEVSRDFAGDYYVGFPNFKRTEGLAAIDLIAILENAANDIRGLTPLQKEGSLKDEILQTVESQTPSKDSKQKSADELRAVADALRAHLPETPAPTSSIVPKILLAIEQIEAEEAQLRLPQPEEVEGVYDLIITTLPRFVYYSNYGNLDSEIYLPHVVQNLQRTDLGAREAAKARTLRVLFTFVRLAPEEILELGRDFRDPQNRKPTDDEIAAIAIKKRERTILLNSAGTDLTKKFREWWKQGDYTFEFDADGDHFRIWVSDSRRPERIARVDCNGFSASI